MLSLGHNIYVRRIHLGWTQDELARKAGLPRPNLSAIEKDKRDATVTTVRKIATGLGVSAGELLDGQPPFLQGAKGNRGFLEKIIHAVVNGEEKNLNEDERLVVFLLEGVVREKLRLSGRGINKQRSFLRTEKNWMLLKALLPKNTLNSLLLRLDKYLISNA